MKFSICCVVAVISGAQARGPDQDMVEIDFEPIGPGPDDGQMLMLGGPAAKKGKSPAGLSEKELDDVLADMLGPQNVPQKSGPHDLPGNHGNVPRNLPSDMDRIPDRGTDAGEEIIGNGRNGLPEGTVVEFDGPPPRSEKEMDELLAALEGRPPSAGKPSKGPVGPDNLPPGDEVIMGNGRNGLPEGVEVVVGDEPPPEMMMMDEGPGPRGGPEQVEGIPVDMLRQLFPPGQVVIEEDDGPVPRGERPPPGADAMIKDLMQEMDQEMMQQMVPMAQQAAEERLPGSCSKEIKAHCRDAQSQLHCLGKYPAEISDGCRADIGKSVPFLCSEAIDEYCDVLMGGILPCLSNQIKNLQGPCKDAVLATKKVIKQVNSKRPTTLAPAAPKTPAAPKVKASLSAREAHLDAKLIGLSQTNAKAKPPPVVPHLQEKLLDHEMHSKNQESPQSSQASPPFMAWFAPLCILLVGAFVAHRSSMFAVNTKTFLDDPARMNQEKTRTPLRTTSGMELLNPAHPGGRFDLDI